MAGLDAGVNGNAAGSLNIDQVAVSGITTSYFFWQEKNRQKNTGIVIYFFIESMLPLFEDKIFSGWFYKTATMFASKNNY